MFSIFKKSVDKVSDTLSAVTTSALYPKEVIEIHNEFNTAGEKLLIEATEIIQKAKAPEIDKAKRLSSLGFSQAKQVQESTDILKKAEISEEVAKLVRRYQVIYPNHKFITEEQVKAICFKYNLICGETKRFKGFVPEKNLKQIEDFKTRYKISSQIRVSIWDTKEEDVINMDDYEMSDSREYVVFRHKSTGKISFQQNKDKYDGINYYGSYINSKGVERRGCRMEVIGLQICAPVKDMDMDGMTIEDGYKMKKIHIPDPVVLQPVQGGYIILTAWGNEASDELVVNQNHN